MIMTKTDKQALRDNANSIIGILENIAGYEPSDIDGDNVELRFEDECGVDTGCDVSIVDQCQKTADVMRALLGELEGSERLRLKFQEANCELCQKLEAAEKLAASMTEERDEFRRRLRLERSCLEDADKRIAELEARTLTVQLPPRVDGSNVPFTAQAWNCCLDEIEKRLTAAGIALDTGA